MPRNRPLLCRAGLAAGFLLLGVACSDDDGDDGGAGDVTTTEDPGEAIAEAIDDLDLDEVDCLVDPDVVAEIAGDEVTEAGGNFGGATLAVQDVEVRLSYAGCRYVLAGGDEITIAEVTEGSGGSPADSFEQIEALVGVDDDTVPVADLGDAAVARREKLYVLDGDQVFLLDVDRVSDSTFDTALLEPLASELLAVDAG